MRELRPYPGQETRRKNASAVRGRRSVLWAAAWFALSQAALVLLVNHTDLALPVIDPTRWHKLVQLRDRAAAAESPPLTVITLGSSHVEWGVRAPQLGRELSDALGRPVVAANWSVGGGACVRALLHLDRLRRAGVRPDLVVIETFPVLLSVTPEFNDVQELALPADGLDGPDVDLLRRFASGRPDLAPLGRPERFAPAYDRRLPLTKMLLPFLLPAERRWQPPLEEFVVPPLSAEQRAAALARSYQEYFGRLQMMTLGDGMQVEALTEAVRRLRAEGTAVVLMATPEGPTFRSWYPPDRWTASRGWLAELGRRLAVPMHDAREWTSSEDLFFDSHHLGNDGSVRFTRWLARDVLPRHLRPR